MLNLKQVTITGADNNVDPMRLGDLSAEFPFVEWGILLSHKRQGGPRYPSLSWIRKLVEIKRHERPMNLSLHIQGRFVRDIIAGSSMLHLTDFWCAFDRCQLNFHGEQFPGNANEYEGLLQFIREQSRKQFIFQFDGSNNHICEMAWEQECKNCHPLFDVSGGAGVVPGEWPEAYWMVNDCDYALHGYAGGLNADNLLQELGRIEIAAKGAPIWTDLETGAMSLDGEYFDLDRVRRCIEIQKPFVNIS